jgi:hypothetical protein
MTALWAVLARQPTYDLRLKTGCKEEPAVRKLTAGSF